MNSKKILMLISSLFILILLCQPILGIGIRGIVNYFQIYEPNAHIELDYEIISNMPPMDVVIGYEEPPEMKGSIKIDTEKMFLRSGEAKPIHVTLDLPSEAKTPGPHDFWVLAVESPPKLRGGQVGAIGTIKSKITIFVPYPGKYLMGKIEAKPVKQGEEMAIDLILTHLGNVTIDSVKAIAEIYDLKDNRIATMQAYQPGNKNDFEISMRPKETKKMYMDWLPAEGLKGKFRVRILVNYDGIDLEVGGIAYVGYKNIEIINTSMQAEAGTVTPYLVRIGSLWNDVLYDVFTDVTFFNSTGDELDTVRSSRYDILPFKSLWFRNYWNTRNLRPGNYTALVKVHFDDLVVEGKYPVELIEPISPVIEKPFFSSTVIWVIVITLIILLLIGGNIFFFIFMKKKSEEQGKEKKPGKKEKLKKKKPKKKEDMEKAAEEELAELEKLDLD